MADASPALTIAEALLGREVVKNHMLQAQFATELAGIRAEIDAMKGAASRSAPISGSAEMTADENAADRPNQGSQE